MNSAVLTDTNETAAVTQYLTFKLGEELFALDIGKVREVIDFTAVTRVPTMPEYMRGVISLRGTVVPVVDLHYKFGMARTKKTVDTCIIIVEINVDGQSSVLGALADAVQEVVDLEARHIEPAPRIGTRLREEFVRGIGKQNDRFLLILDIDKVFSSGELASVQADRQNNP